MVQDKTSPSTCHINQQHKSTFSLVYMCLICIILCSLFLFMRRSYRRQRMLN